jgi:hypothetical protein
MGDGAHRTLTLELMAKRALLAIAPVIWADEGASESANESTMIYIAVIDRIRSSAIRCPWMTKRNIAA